jgi:hypothetical protein
MFLLHRKHNISPLKLKWMIQFRKRTRFLLRIILCRQNTELLNVGADDRKHTNCGWLSRVNGGMCAGKPTYLKSKNKQKHEGRKTEVEVSE